jgi:hypothetical protein
MDTLCFERLVDSSEIGGLRVWMAVSPERVEQHLKPCSQRDPTVSLGALGKALCDKLAPACCDVSFVSCETPGDAVVHDLKKLAVARYHRACSQWDVPPLVATDTVFTRCVVVETKVFRRCSHDEREVSVVRCDAIVDV